MKKKSIFKASFEESLNLLDDGFLQYQKKDYYNIVIDDKIIGSILLKDIQEGKLSKLRAKLVCEKSLEKVGIKLGIGEYLFLGKGEEKTGGRNRTSIIADATEAVIGAIFLDGGYEEASRFILREFKEIIQNVLSGNFEKDYKSLVQEELQKDGSIPEIYYCVDKEIGPDHHKTFYVHLECNGKRLGSGVGNSKKEAEQNAACDTLNGGYI